MSDYAIIFQILGVLCALFFIFLTVMNFKTWRWFHALTTFALFCAVVTFMVYASLVMKARTAWIESHSRYVAAVDKQTKNYDTLFVGDPADQASVENSLTYYRSELARALVDRGRVWRGCTPAVNADGTVTLTMNLGAVAAPPAAADPMAPAPAAPAAPAAAPVVAKHNLQVGDIVFAFKEAPTPDGMTLPAYFVSDFRVTAQTDANVTLAMTPTMLHGPIQPNEVDATWMLYEVLPPDSHEVFSPAGLHPLLPKESNKAQRLDFFTKIGFLPGVADAYARDGGPGDANDPEENTWVRVKFKKSYEVVVDASAMVSPVEERHFDAQGQAQVSRLARSTDPKTPDPVKFAPNDIAVFDKATADNLVNLGIVDRQELIYYRKLNDYEQAFKTISRQLYVIAERAAMTTRDTATENAAVAKANEQYMKQEAEKLLLDADYQKVVYERDETTKYADALAAQVKAKRAEMSRLYLQNKAMHAEIEEISRRLTEEIEKRSRLAESN